MEKPWRPVDFPRMATQFPEPDDNPHAFETFKGFDDWLSRWALDKEDDDDTKTNL